MVPDDPTMDSMNMLGYLHINIYIYICMYIFTCVYIYTYDICVCMGVHVYPYVCVHIYIHISSNVGHDLCHAMKWGMVKRTLLVEEVSLSSTALSLLMGVSLATKYLAHLTLGTGLKS